MRSARRTRRPLVALIALVAALAVGYAVRAVRSGSPAGRPATTATTATTTTTTATQPAGAGTVALSTLPPQAAATVRAIVAGGPFPYPQHDGVVFGNQEGHLPPEADGYYREYTVPTPGSPDRGPRRIITGGGRFWYTGDHYQSFVLVDVQR